MTTTPDPHAAAIAQAEDKLARLVAQVEAMQAVLARLRLDVEAAERRLDQSRVAQVIEANERLVMASLASQAEADTAAMALHEAEQATLLDALTGLPNRTALVDRCTQVLAGARRRPARFALLFLDLNNFKALNDQHGHAFGDSVLRVAAKRMLSVVREVDTVSRFGGDEFVILLPGAQQPGDAQVVADKLMAAIGVPMALNEHLVSVTASVGIALYPEDGETIETLLACADATMYEAKRAHHAARPGPFMQTAPAGTSPPAPPAACDRSTPAPHLRRAR